MHNKTNKELAVEVAIAMLNSNQRIIRPMNNGSGEFIRSLKSDEVINIINKVYNSLQQLDKNED